MEALDASTKEKFKGKLNEDKKVTALRKLFDAATVNWDNTS